MNPYVWKTAKKEFNDRGQLVAERAQSNKQFANARYQYYDTGHNLKNIEVNYQNHPWMKDSTSTTIKSTDTGFVHFCVFDNETKTEYVLNFDPDGNFKNFYYSGEYNEQK